uniref:Uncharacterized protein n=1 Tax=Setaria italica TaxID=4555 RepID=K4A467_SETIT
MEVSFRRLTSLHTLTEAHPSLLQLSPLTPPPA